jgi:hypothetical protein
LKSILNYLISWWHQRALARLPGLPGALLMANGPNAFPRYVYRNADGTYVGGFKAEWDAPAYLEYEDGRIEPIAW